MFSPVGLIKPVLNETNGFWFSLLNRSCRSTHRVAKTKVTRTEYGKRDTCQNFDIRLQQNISAMPKSLRQCVTDITCLYSFVLDEEVAGVMTDIIKPSLLETVRKKKYQVIEANPGLGLLTEKLLQIVPKLVVYNMYEFPDFRRVYDRYENRVELRKDDVLCVVPDEVLRSRVVYPDALRYEKDEKKILIGINPRRIFFRRLIYTILVTDFNFLRNVELYFVLSNDVYHCLTDSESRFSKCIDYAVHHLLLDLKILKTFPQNKFFPNLVSKKEVVFARILRKETDLAADELMAYMNFLRQIGKNKHDLVIAVLENWLPGCGPYFISRGLSMTNRILDLSSRDFFTLYKDILNLRGYKNAKQILRNACKLQLE